MRLKTVLLSATALLAAVAAPPGARATTYPQPIPLVNPAPSKLNVVIEGQSNAAYFLIYGSGALVYCLNYLLGFDGVHQTVQIIGGSGVTAWGGTSLIPYPPSIGANITWLGGSYPNWTEGDLETSFVNYLKALPAATKALPTAIVWVHNENDSENPAITQAEWASAVAYNIGQARAALGKTAASAPVDFAYAPFDFAPGTMQAIGRSPEIQTLKAGFEALTAIPSFNAAMGAQVSDSNMDGPPGGPAQPMGELHFDQSDINQLAWRLALTLSNHFCHYALPSSPQSKYYRCYVDSVGMQAISAKQTGPSTLSVSFQAAYNGDALQPLSSMAAEGAGWVVVNGTQTVYAKAASLSGNTVNLTFTGPLPSAASGRLYYGWGTGRVSVQTSAPIPNQTVAGPGEGAAILDAAGLPVFTAAQGLAY
jgi:hypothetical protein